MKRFGLILLRVFTAFDWPLLAILLMFAALGLTVMHSAVGGTDWRFADQSRNFVIAFFAMWIMALIPPKWLMKLALPFYVVGVVLLLGVEFFGETSKGATRWLNLGVTRIQPSEMMKIGVPMMLAWYFQRHEGAVRIRDFLAAAAMFRAVRPDRCSPTWARRCWCSARLLRDLLRRPVVQAADPGLAGHHRHRHPDLLRRPAVRAGRELGGAARLPEAPCLHAAQSQLRSAGQGFPPSSP